MFCFALFFINLKSNDYKQLANSMPFVLIIQRQSKRTKCISQPSKLNLYLPESCQFYGRSLKLLYHNYTTFILSRIIKGRRNGSSEVKKDLASFQLLTRLCEVWHLS